MDMSEYKGIIAGNMVQILAIIVKLWIKAVELPTFSAEYTSK